MKDSDPTPPLAEFLVEFEQDDNIWWRIGCGHHLNLFEAAVEEIEQLKSRMTIGQISGETCSGCGEPNTWHPDCPVCEVHALRVQVKRLNTENDLWQVKYAAIRDERDETNAAIKRLQKEHDKYKGLALSWAEEKHADWCCGPGEMCCCGHREAKIVRIAYLKDLQKRKPELFTDEDIAYLHSDEE
jgi:hypothetical protein